MGAMYFISKGEIVLYNPGRADEGSLDIEHLVSLDCGDETSCGAKVLKNCVAADYFGEIALLGKTSRRSASAAARMFSELLCLPRSDFETLLLDYPEFADNLKRQAERNYSKQFEAAKNGDNHGTVSCPHPLSESSDCALPGAPSSGRSSLRT